MEFLIKHANVSKQRVACIAVAVFDNKTQSASFNQLDKLSDGYLSQLIKQGEVSGKLGEANLIHNIPNLLSRKILFVGCGQSNLSSVSEQGKVITTLVKQLTSLNIKQIALDLFIAHPDLNTYQMTRQLVEGLLLASYHFDQYKRKKAPPVALTQLILLAPQRSSQAGMEQAIKQGSIIAKAVNATRDLANQPSNVCNATYLATQGRLLAKRYPQIKTTVIDEKQMAKLGMNAYLAVGRGSSNESFMTILSYQGAKDKRAAPIVLVGKGLTFDSGGISIKPAAGMDEMKYDMCGAATVYGVMQAVAELGLALNVIGVMAGCENMPGGDAYRPGDILTTLSGTTVEVINTDAEGRLVLCDVLTYVERFKPQAVIDMATLTGACIVALGHHYSGLLGNNKTLSEQLLLAGEQAGDKAWSLPIDSDFQQQIDSSCADIMNSSGREGGTITAACFLSRFTENYPWAHLDIAGTAWKSGSQKGATGRPVALLIQYLLNSAS